ncbi:nuclear transport factor 2-like protein [Luteimonas sp. RIT-PG2_3]
MNVLNLPEPIAAYFRADRQDAGAVARCFTRDACVRDEGQTHQGIAAIEAWKADTSSRFSYTTTPIHLEKLDREYRVTGHVVGDFPGSPVDLRYRFTLERGKIASLEIAP